MIRGTDRFSFTAGVLPTTSAKLRATGFSVIVPPGVVLPTLTAPLAGCPWNATPWSWGGTGFSLSAPPGVVLPTPTGPEDWGGGEEDEASGAEGATGVETAWLVTTAAGEVDVTATTAAGEEEGVVTETGAGALLPPVVKTFKLLMVQ